MRDLWMVFSLTATLLMASAQIQIGIQVDRDQFLLYEPIPVKMTILNNSGAPLELSGDWLSFMVTRSDGSGVRGDNRLSVETLKLEAGERRTIGINVTPLYSIRETGQYLIQGVVEFSRLQFVSQTVAVNVAPGQKVWLESRPVNGVQRVYSLIRFSPQSTNTLVFIRVEEPQENKVYATYCLGDMISFIPPEIKFDKEGKLHILHPKGQGTFCYSRISVEGNLENQADYHANSRTRPVLLAGEDGLVMVQGGESMTDRPKRFRLSQGQRSLTSQERDELSAPPVKAK